MPDSYCASFLLQSVSIDEEFVSIIRTVPVWTASLTANVRFIHLCSLAYDLAIVMFAHSTKPFHYRSDKSCNCMRSLQGSATHHRASSVRWLTPLCDQGGPTIRRRNRFVAHVNRHHIPHRCFRGWGRNHHGSDDAGRAARYAAGARLCSITD